MVENGNKEPTNTTSYSWMLSWMYVESNMHERQDNLVHIILYWVVDEFGFEKITSIKSSKEAWDILEKEYMGDDRVK